MKAMNIVSAVNDALDIKLTEDKSVVVYGEDVGFEGGVSSLRACLSPDLEAALWHDVDTPPVPTIYQRFIAAIRGEGAADPDFARGAALQRLLDRAEESSARSGVALAV